VAIFCLQPLVAQSLARSTHDWPNGVTPCSLDRWMDVKTPGDGRTYCIGTTIVPDTRASVFPHFSGAPVEGPLNFTEVTSSRQIAILQVTDSSGVILWQKYFHGKTVGGGNLGGGRSTLGRAVAVAPGATPSETRIAICGETDDRELPNAISRPNTHFGNYFASGYVAVYDGDGNLKWSRQFYGQDDSAATAITDVSIHVANGNDVVTYCGASTNGAFADQNHPVQSTMVPTNCSFQATVPTIPPCGDTPAPHNIHNAPFPDAVTAQWDGIVGRVQQPHGFTQTGQATANAPLEFHGIVGGRDQDGLFGISELSPTEFIVVGTTTKSNAGNGSTGIVVPLTNPSVFNAPQNTFCFTNSATTWQSFGTVYRFIAAPQNLILASSTLIGSDGANTVARDVLWHNGLVWIVGSTNDPNFTTLDPNPFRSQLYEAFTGFVVTCVDPSLPFVNATLVDKHVDLLTGIAAWHEYPDHVAVFGRHTDIITGVRSLYVASLFRDTSVTSTPVPSIRVVRSTTLGGTSDTHPAYTEGMTSTLQATSSVPWGSSVGAPDAGGIAVDERGRINVVGSTKGDDYPVFPKPPNTPSREPQSHYVPSPSPSTDGVRSELDMLPTDLSISMVGACRTDGTGTCPSPGWSPQPGYTGTGGTTPTCGTNSPAIRRMFIDFEGDLAAGSTNAVILVDRPPDGAILRASVMWIGFPATLPTVTPEGIEVWVGSQTPVGQFYTLTGQSLVVPLGTLPSGSIQFSIQFICLLSTQACASNSASFLGASPALVFGY
jgi:hypothetical protein